MDQVWKYLLTPVCGIELPLNAKILKVAVQNGEVYVWVQGDSELPKYTAKFMSFGTGQPIPDDLRLNYLDTVFLDALVYHVYEVLG